MAALGVLDTHTELMLTQDAQLLQLGARTGLHPDHIGRLERGDWRGGSRIDNIRKLAEVLEVDPAELVREG